MRIIAVIEPACADTADRQPAVVRQILDHLGLSAPATRFRSPPAEFPALAACETPKWTHEPLEEDLPLPDPLTP